MKETLIKQGQEIADEALAFPGSYVEITGVKIISGGFYILAGSAKIYSGPDVIASWTDSGPNWKKVGEIGTQDTFTVQVTGEAAIKSSASIGTGTSPSTGSDSFELGWLSEALISVIVEGQSHQPSVSAWEGTGLGAGDIFLATDQTKLRRGYARNEGHGVASTSLAGGATEMSVLEVNAWVGGAEPIIGLDAFLNYTPGVTITFDVIVGIFIATGDIAITNFLAGLIVGPFFPAAGDDINIQVGASIPGLFGDLGGNVAGVGVYNRLPSDLTGPLTGNAMSIPSMTFSTSTTALRYA